MKLMRTFALAVLVTVVFAACDSEETTPELSIPESYVSENYDANVTAENTVVTELSSLASAANDAESNAQAQQVAAISYPQNLSSVTLPAYNALIEDWLVELVKSANDDDGFQTPATGEAPAEGEEGGLLGSRLLDENGLELEQMIEKGSFGAALYNHALDLLENGDRSDAAIVDQLAEIHGFNATLDPAEANAAAKYTVRRSNQTTETGFYYDIRNALITAKAAIEAGSEFNQQRDEAFDAYLEAWEKANFATVIYYCNSTKVQIQNATDDNGLGNAMHAYAEGVGFAHGFKGLGNKIITDAQIDNVLELLEAPAGATPQSYKFLNDASLLANLDQIVEDLQEIYGFTDEEVASFYVNNPGS